MGVPTGTSVSYVDLISQNIPRWVDLTGERFPLYSDTLGASVAAVGICRDPRCLRVDFQIRGKGAPVRGLKADIAYRIIPRMEYHLTESIFVTDRDLKQAEQLIKSENSWQRTIKASLVLIHLRGTSLRSITLHAVSVPLPEYRNTDASHNTRNHLGIFIGKESHSDKNVYRGTFSASEQIGQNSMSGSVKPNKNVAILWRPGRGDILMSLASPEGTGGRLNFGFKDDALLLPKVNPDKVLSEPELFRHFLK